MHNGNLQIFVESGISWLFQLGDLSNCKLWIFEESSQNSRLSKIKQNRQGTSKSEVLLCKRLVLKKGINELI